MIVDRRLVVLAGMSLAAGACAAASLAHRDETIDPPTTTTTLAAVTTVPTSVVALIPPVTLTRPTTTAAVVPPEKDHTAPDAAQVVEGTVRAFIGTWLLQDTAEARAAALVGCGCASPQLVAALASVPAENLPEAAVTSVTVPAVGENQATATAALSNGWTVTFDVVATADGWKIRSYDGGNP